MSGLGKRNGEAGFLGYPANNEQVELDRVYVTEVALPEFCQTFWQEESCRKHTSFVFWKCFLSQKDLQHFEFCCGLQGRLKKDQTTVPFLCIASQCATNTLGLFSSSISDYRWSLRR